MRKKPYTDKFFARNNNSLPSARVIAPLIIKIVSPRSVADAGCGRGEFLSVFIENGIANVMGIDGEWVDKQKLKIPAEYFITHDLEKPFSTDKSFDLVISIETAEHISEKAAPCFIETLTSLGDIVLFSAAVPYQGGRNHLNERWPGYWAELFRGKGFLCFDCLRKIFWEDKRVSFWYSQNMFLFVREEKALDYPSLGMPVKNPLPLIHPALYLKKTGRRNYLKSFMKSAIRK
jgi:SAM-dependent methyltransferase